MSFPDHKNQTKELFKIKENKKIIQGFKHYFGMADNDPQKHKKTRVHQDLNHKFKIIEYFEISKITRKKMNYLIAMSVDINL